MLQLNPSTTAIVLASLLSTTFAFSPNTRTHLPSTRSTSTQLFVGATFDPRWGDASNGSSDDPFVITKMAQECALSDTCSAEEAGWHLQSLLHVQSDCAAGILIGDDDVCNDVSETAEVVANLRVKVDSEPNLEIRKYAQGVIATSLTASALVATAAMAFLALNAQPDAIAFTAQEWWWALKDGYLGTMISHYIRNGGLAGELDGESSLAFTVQEWVWAAQGGYMDTMMSQLFKNGGLVSDASTLEASVSLTPQEVWWAVKGSYVDTLASHVYKNGGLATLDFNHDAVPFSAQEWKLAMRDGYLDTMISHYYKSGGL